MGNNQSSENPDVYSYHEAVLKQGAQAATSDSSDESDDEMQEGYSREAPTSSNVEVETNFDSREEISDSEEISAVVSESDVENPEQTTLDQSEEGEEVAVLEETSETFGTENEAEALNSSSAPKNGSDNADFITPPSSPSPKEPSPGPSRRSTRLQLKASTINTILKKRPRLSMRDSEDDSDDDDPQYTTPPSTRKTIIMSNDVSDISHSSSSKNEAENKVIVEVHEPSNKVNTTPDTPSSSHQSEASFSRTGTPPSHENGRPNLRSSGGEGRPFLRARRSVQMLGKNAVLLKKVVSIPTTAEQVTESTGGENVAENAFKSVNESNSCTNPTKQNLDSENITITNSAPVIECAKTPKQPAIASSGDSTATSTTTSNSVVTSNTDSENVTTYTATAIECEKTPKQPAIASSGCSTAICSTTSNSVVTSNTDFENVTTYSATAIECEKTPKQPAIASSGGSTAICSTTSNSVTCHTGSENITVASTQSNLTPETQQDQSPVNVVTQNTTSTVSNQTPPEAKSGGNDVLMRDVNSEKESKTPKFSASVSNDFEPMDTQTVENSVNDITIPKTFEVVNTEQAPQNRLLVFGNRNFMSSKSTKDLQPSLANNTSDGLLSFSQLANSQTAAPKISNVTATSSACMVYQHSQPQASTSSQTSTFVQTTQIQTPAPSISSTAAPSTAQIHTPSSPQVIHHTPKVANTFPFSPPSTLLSVQKCCIFPISSNFDMTIRQGDIIKQDAAAIVNSTDIHLRHQGAVSRLIAEAASPQMMYECQQYLMNHGGSLGIVHVMDTIAGGRLNINVERIIHVIPPSGSSTHFDQLSVNKLVSAYLQCMLHSDRLLNSTSLAFPLLGAGSFPTDISINAFYNAVLIFLSDKRSLSRLNDIRLIINEPQIFQFAVDYFTSCYENILTQGIDKAVAEALDGFYGNKNSNLSSFCVKDEVDGNNRSNRQWSATASLRNLFRGPPVKRPRL